MHVWSEEGGALASHHYPPRLRAYSIPAYAGDAPASSGRGVKQPSANQPSERNDRHAYGWMAFAALSLSCTCAPSNAQPSIGQFELKTLESEPGAYEFQSQNAWAWGQPSRRFQVRGPDDFIVDENSVVRARHAIELEMGLTDFLKMRIGVEFEQERIEEPETLAQANDFDSLQFDEIGAELIAVLKPREGDGIGFGLVVELEGPVDQEESNSLVLGSIFEYRSGRWSAAAVPMVVHSFGGDAEEGEKIDNKWDFAYAAQLMYAFSARWSLALEGYGTVERLGNSGRPSEAAQVFGDFNQHRAGPILYRTFEFGGSRRSPQVIQGSALAETTREDEGATLSIGLGLLEGLNANTPDHTLKLSIEVDF